MKKLTLLVLFASTVPVVAQQADYTFTVTPQEAQIIGQALVELPYKTSATILQKLQAQLAAQQEKEKQKVEPKAEPSPK